MSIEEALGTSNLYDQSSGILFTNDSVRELTAWGSHDIVFAVTSASKGVIHE